MEGPVFQVKVATCVGGPGGSGGQCWLSWDCLRMDLKVLGTEVRLGEEVGDPDGH